jgi:hypothetical protein
MKLHIKSGKLVSFAASSILILVLLSACTEASTSAPVVDRAASEPPGGTPVEVIVYAAELPAEALSELDFINDSSAPGGKLIGLPNTGDELDPPPENDPHLTFTVQVQRGVPYRCWIHMKVGTPKGRSTANVVWVQFSDSVNQANEEIFRPSTGSYLTAQGPQQEGWTWVSCDAAGNETSQSLVHFQASGDVTVRIQAGAEGVGFDQFLLSPARFLEGPPSEPIVVK